MGNNDIKVKDLSTTSSLSTDNKLMLLTDEANNTVQNITVENALANSISSNANNSLSIGTDKKLYTPDISGEVGDLDNLITTDKTDIVSAINEVKGDTNAITGAVVPASKGWLEEGEIYQKDNWYGEKLYNDVYTYNHSTFDVSKFTVVGSPIITDDGIASVTADGNMTQRVSIPFNFDLTVKKWSIISNFTTDSTVGAGYTIGSWRTNDSINCYHVGSYVFSFSIYVNIDGTRTQVVSGNTPLPNLVQFRTNTKYVQIVSRNNDTYTYTIYNAENPSETGTITITSEYDLYTASVLCVYSNASSSSFKSCNLKEVKVTVNDIPAFSGNKTGIDTIKSTDYTVVGTPTISADGIASNFSKTNHPVINLPSIDTSKQFSIELSFMCTDLTGIQQFVGSNSYTDYNNFNISIDASHRFQLYASSNGTTWDIHTGAIQGYTIVANKWYDVKYEHTADSEYKFSYKFSEDENWNELWSITSSLEQYINTSETAVGVNLYNSSTIGLPLNGYIDLNTIKIYNDSKLIYQACLLIPYNESSTGSKIVDVVYRDRVIDVFEQYGSANYYTIDETNQNATLPMGELYGLIRQSDSDKIYKAIVPCYDITKAISVPLLGNYTAPADGYVCSPNMVLTLDPDNGYENFSLTIVRNTQSMTMISCTGPTAFPFCLPVLKNDVLTLAADVTVTSNVYFIPREGV